MRDERICLASVSPLAVIRDEVETRADVSRGARGCDARTLVADGDTLYFVVKFSGPVRVLPPSPSRGPSIHDLALRAVMNKSAATLHPPHGEGGWSALTFSLSHSLTRRSSHNYYTDHSVRGRWTLVTSFRG